jgi:type IV pilus assembly protein PilX
MKGKPVNRRERPSRNTERGFVLITGMLFLVVLTILVVSLMRTSILEEKMIANARDWNIAFQAAEAALRDAERDIVSGVRFSGLTGFVAECSTASSANGAGLCLPNRCTDTSTSGDCLPIWIDLEKKQNDAGWIKGSNSGKSVVYGAKTGATSLPGVAAQPRYIIEVLTIPSGNLDPTKPQELYRYRATAVGFGASNNTRVLLQATFRQY